MGVLYAHHIVNTPMDRLHINIRARCTSVFTLGKTALKSNMLFAYSRNYRMLVLFLFCTASFTSFSVSTVEIAKQHSQTLPG